MIRLVCEITESGRVRTCATLRRSLGRSIGGGGLEEQARSNFETEEITRFLIVLFSGEYMRRGAILIFCPFCGAGIVPSPRAAPGPTLQAAEAA